MLFTIKKIALSLFVWFALVTVSATSAAAKKDIIYEYDTITQKKGQSFQDALKSAQLSQYQTELMMQLPVLREAKSDRQFRVIYALSKGKRLMREVRVTRGNRIANFVLTGGVGSHKFVSQKSQISTKHLKQSSQSIKANKAAQQTESTTLATPSEKLFSMKVMQAKGQKLTEALAPLKLSKTQLTIINSGKFVKSALSNRQLTLYFTGSQKKKLLRGVTIQRGKRRVDYMVRKSGQSFLLKNLRVVGESKRKEVLANFSKASAVKLAVAKTTTQKSTVAKNSSAKSKSSKQSVNRKGNVTDSGNYRVYRIRQKKGQSLSSAMKGFSFSSGQRDLMNNIPVSSRAKSTRYFYPLFEKKGSRKYLKAVRVVRGKSVAEFVLAKYKGKWTWADKRGKVKTSGGGGFLRYPLNFRRISSSFNLRRRHPITRRIRPHKGTDFAARHGTPIWAPAGGVVTFAGRQRGYGITLVIDHGNGYKTKYAHLSRIMKGARKGKRVRKKQIVARVGNTGLSSGAHLHYEVIVNGRHRNPMTVRLPGGSGGGSKTLASAKKSAAIYLPQIRRML